MEIKEKEPLNGVELDSALKAVYELLQTYPGTKGIVVKVEELKKDAVCIGIFCNSSGAYYIRKNIMGGFQAAFPFMVIYRAMPRTNNQKISKIDFMNNLGQWLERREVMIGGTMCKLEKYPTLTNGRVIEKIEITSPAFKDASSQAGEDDYVIVCNMTYRKDE